MYLHMLALSAVLAIPVQYYSPPAAPLYYPSTGTRPWWVPPSAIPGTTPGTSLQSVPYAPLPPPPPAWPMQPPPR